MSSRFSISSYEGLILISLHPWPGSLNIFALAKIFIIFLYGISSRKLHLVKGLYHLEGEHRGKKVAEFTANHAVVVVHACLVEFKGGLVESHDKLNLPSRGVDLVNGFGLDVHVTFKEHGAEDGPGLLKFHKTVVVLLFASPKPVALLLGSLAGIPE